MNWDASGALDEVFTAPVTVTRAWVRRRGEKVEPYECDETA